MDKIIEYIHSVTNGQFSWLKYVGATFKKSTDTLSINFEFNGNYNLNEEELIQIKQTIKSFLSVKIENLKVEFKKISVNVADLKNDLEKFLTSRNEHLAYDIKNLKIDLSDETIKIDIPFDGVMLTENEKNEAKDILDQNLETKYLTKFNLNFLELKKDEDILTKRNNQMLEQIKAEQLKVQQKIAVSNIKNIIGSLNDLTPIEISSISKIGVSVVVAGTVKDFAEKSYTRKKDDELEERQYYSFNLEQDNSFINCVLFLTDEQKKLFSPLTEEQTVILMGEVDEFNHRKNIKVKALALCDLSLMRHEQQQAKAVYEFVKPEPYVMVEQINFFEENNTISKPYLLSNSFVVFDLETTGLNYEDNKIIEIGAVKVLNGKIIEQFSSFVNPEEPIPADATSINGITDEMVKDAPKIDQVLPDFYKFCSDSILVAYNIDFDFSFISYNAKKMRYVFNNKRDDAMIRAKTYLKGLKNYKLKTVCESQDISLIDAHRAINDTIATAKLFIKLIEKYS